MTYPHLENAPKDHLSPEFLDYLRKENEVLWESEDWLTIRNCKYGWPTAFAKINNPSLIRLITEYGHLEWKVKPEKDRSVKRFHIHFIQPKN